MVKPVTVDIRDIAKELNLETWQVEAVIELLEEGNTIPFITRYRRDRTGGLDEEQIRRIQSRINSLRLLAERKQTILRSIESQGKLTPELEKAIIEADSPSRLEDLYLPYKPKKQTLATLARSRGLQKLAEEILQADPVCSNLDARAADFVDPDKKIHHVADALAGAGHIIAEYFSERADLRAKLREMLRTSAHLVSVAVEPPKVIQKVPPAATPAPPKGSAAGEGLPARPTEASSGALPPVSPTGIATPAEAEASAGQPPGPEVSAQSEELLAAIGPKEGVLSAGQATGISQDSLPLSEGSLPSGQTDTGLSEPATRPSPTLLETEPPTAAEPSPGTAGESPPGVLAVEAGTATVGEDSSALVGKETSGLAGQIPALSPGPEQPSAGVEPGGISEPASSSSPASAQGKDNLCGNPSFELSPIIATKEISRQEAVANGTEQISLRGNLLGDVAEGVNLNELGNREQITPRSAAEAHEPTGSQVTSSAGPLEQGSSDLSKSAVNPEAANTGEPVGSVTGSGHWDEPPGKNQVVAEIQSLPSTRPVGEGNELENCWDKGNNNGGHLPPDDPAFPDYADCSDNGNGSNCSYNEDPTTSLDNGNGSSSAGPGHDADCDNSADWGGNGGHSEVPDNSEDRTPPESGESPPTLGPNLPGNSDYCATGNSHRSEPRSDSEGAPEPARSEIGSPTGMQDFSAEIVSSEWRLGTSEISQSGSDASQVGSETSSDGSETPQAGSDTSEGGNAPAQSRVTVGEVSASGRGSQANFSGNLSENVNVGEHSAVSPGGESFSCCPGYSEPKSPENAPAETPMESPSPMPQSQRELPASGAEGEPPSIKEKELSETSPVMTSPEGEPSVASASAFEPVRETGTSETTAETRRKSRKRRKPKKRSQPAPTQPAPAPAESRKLTRAEQRWLRRRTAFRDYFSFRQRIDALAPHQILAINRGERLGILRVKLEYDFEPFFQAAQELCIPPDHPHAEFLRGCLRDALLRLVMPALERDIRRELTEKAEEHAIKVFARNLRKLLLQPPVRGRRVLAIDPGLRNGCTAVALDEFGNVLGYGTFWVVGAPEEREKGKQLICHLVERYRIDLIAIGNGTGSRQTEHFVADLLANDLRAHNLRYCIVNEAGASLYSTSPIGREEFPDYTPELRSAISIGRRLQDPLSELVKIEPAHLGVGLYQHDIQASHLKSSLAEVVESCVNYAGVDVNTASVALLRYVSGLNQLTAKRIYDYRRQNGPFRNRAQLREVPGIGEATFIQAAGFLKISGGDNPLDATWIHPESYPIAEKILEVLGFKREDLRIRGRMEELRAAVEKVDPPELARQLGLGELSLRDILSQLARPGRDPREDLPGPIFRQGILRLQDLKPGMELMGTVANVVDFGAFVDFGLPVTGLVHISELSTKYVRDVHEVVEVGDIVHVWVKEVDLKRLRVSLTMIPPGAPRPGPSRRSATKRTEAPAGPKAQPQAAASGPSITGQLPGEKQPQRGRERRRAEAGPAPSPTKTPEVAAAVPPSGPLPGEKPASRPEPEKPRAKSRWRGKESKKPPVQLSEEVLSGKQPMRSFAELAQFFRLKAQQQPKQDQTSERSSRVRSSTAAGQAPEIPPAPAIPAPPVPVALGTAPKGEAATPASVPESPSSEAGVSPPPESAQLPTESAQLPNLPVGDQSPPHAESPKPPVTAPASSDSTEHA